MTLNDPEGERRVLVEADDLQQPAEMAANCTTLIDEFYQDPGLLTIYFLQGCFDRRRFGVSGY